MFIHDNNVSNKTSKEKGAMVSENREETRPDLYHIHLACFVPAQSWRTCLETAACNCPLECRACENICIRQIIPVSKD